MQEPGLFDWGSIFAGCGWVHATGITPAISPGARSMWTGALDAATSLGLPISFDLNHRPQLGPLDELWGWVRPYVGQFRMIILSVGNLEGLAELEGYEGTIPAGDLAENDDSSYRDAMRFFHKKWGGPAVAVCFKRRGGDNVQRRWAAIVNDSGLVSSQDEPVWHVPKEETGGGSAWASGFLYGLLEGGDAYADPRSAALRGTLRSADVLSALCQESVGDHSTVRLPGARPAPCPLPPLVCVRSVCSGASGFNSSCDVGLRAVRACGRRVRGDDERLPAGDGGVRGRADRGRHPGGAALSGAQAVAK